ncbi:MAG: hypothetical protein ACQERX_05210 [Bacillota bacterium]
MKLNYTKELLKLYFTGELERKINKFKGKAEAELPDYYYSTLTGVDNTDTYAGRTNGWSDPTGNTASYIADMKKTREAYYKKFNNIKKIIEQKIRLMDNKDLMILKVYLNVTNKTKTKHAENTNISTSTINKQAEHIIKSINQSIERQEV